MKILPIISAVFAASLIVTEDQVGPIYTMYDGCSCGQNRAWLEFAESPILRGKQLFLRVEEPGDLQHKHQFWDPQYGGQYHFFLYTAVGFGVLGAISWIYPRKRVRQV